jgi:hypothetical protein
MEKLKRRWKMPKVSHKHFVKNGKYICNKKASVAKEFSTTKKDKVTCKLCYKILNSKKKK